MPQDAFTLRYLCEELNTIFKGGKINRITQPTNDELVFTIYTGKGTEKLLLDVNPSSPRMGIIQKEKDSPLTAPNFCMLMRKHLLSATVDSIELVGFDRIVKIECTSCAEFFDAQKKVIYVELMGRYSNIILTQNGKILGGNRGVNMFDNGVRPLIVGLDYVYPPSNDKLLPKDEKLVEYFNGFNGEDLAQYICKGVQGIATSTANEIVNQYLEKTGNLRCENFGQKFTEFLVKFLYNATKKACVVTEGDFVKDVCVFDYKTTGGNKIFFNSLHEAEEYYFCKRDSVKKFTTKRDRLTSVCSTAIKKVKKRLTAINAKKKDASNAEENRVKGELLLANIYRIDNGVDQVELENYYDGTTIKISLDSRLSASKNAENYYKKYNKQKRTLQALEPQRESAENELNYLQSILEEIALCEDIEELNSVQFELESLGLIKVQKQSSKNKKPTEISFKRYDIDGFTVRVGRNNLENDKVTFTAKPNDIWLHAKDYHSTHVVIETNGKSVPENVILKCAQICAYYSKGREGGKTEVVYTPKKNVKKPSGAKPGFCVYENYKSVVVQPQKHIK